MMKSHSWLAIVTWTIVSRETFSLSTIPTANPTCQRRLFVGTGASFVASLFPLLTFNNQEAAAATTSSYSRQCTDIESCREIGEQRVVKDMTENPVFRLANGVRYKQLKAGFGTSQVSESSTINMIYSISQASGAYMYSRGFGYEKIDVGNGQLEPDVAGLDSYLVTLGTGNLPKGVEQALVGMKKGERRRIEVPPGVGFETSNWKPEPTTRRGKAQIAGYQGILRGRGSSQPPFPAPTIWEVEVLSIRGSN
jgi:FKBP-type peptidyl-prolyl cis-trans isomerase